MATNLGLGVSDVPEFDGYNYDMVVFQKGKPPLDSELNLVQELQNAIGQRNLNALPSGWLTAYEPYADRSLAISSTSDMANKFYTQNPLNAKPEFALVNGHVVYVTNTGTSTTNANIIDLGIPPTDGNRVNGVILEVWRALIDPSLGANKPDPATVIDTLYDIFMQNSNNGWICGTNGLLLRTTNGGVTWPIIAIDTKRNLNAIHFYNGTVGWVVGDNGTMARSSSSGQTWIILNSPTVVNLNSVHAVSQNVVWAVGDNGLILKASNGITFTPVSSRTTSNLNKVYFSDVSHGWIVGDNGTILLTSNGGNTWTTVSSGTTQKLNSVCFYNVNFGYAVGDNGTILRSSDGGITWINQSNNVAGGAVTNNLHDVNLYPKLDVEVLSEEVSAQLGATGTSFTTDNLNISVATWNSLDRRGVVTNNPADVIVKVNGVPVTVLSVNGLSGVVVLASAPGIGAVTEIHYFYQYQCAVFEGKAWIVGTTGLVLNTDNIGSSWVIQANGGYDIQALSFISQTNGWLCGSESIIRMTTNGGLAWVAQQSDIFSRQVQRIYPEGNTGVISGFLDENSIHPDAAIETTKRVQVQYQIRIIEAVDPLANPEAGLNSNILGAGPDGPNAIGTFPYENLGTVNGDYGCWRAKHNDTLDGYVYAVPMFFVARRNIQAYSSTNQNGQHIKNSSSIRPDLLLATNVVLSDIGDCRRKVIIPSAGELFQKTFDALSANTLRTNFARGVGDQYGTEILDASSIDGASLLDVAAGTYNSQSVINNAFTRVDLVDPLPGPTPLKKSPLSASGIFHPASSHYKAIYNSTESSIEGKLIPGQFYGMGTSDASFEFNNSALDSSESSLLFYNLYADFIADSTTGLTYAPVNPGLVIKTDGINYQGVLDSTSAKILESWDSNITGYPNYAVAYSIKDPSDTFQQTLASPVEAHTFIRVSDTSNAIVIGRQIQVDPEAPSITYNINNVRQVNNKTSGFSHKISNINILDGTNITITAVPGYEFVQNSILEVVSSVISSSSSSNTRNGAVANFNSRLRGISNLCRSDYLLGTASSGEVVFTPSNGELILGWSTTDTTGSLTQTICWNNTTGSMVQANPTLDPGVSLTLDGGGITNGVTYKIQCLLKETNITGSLLVGYKYAPYQTQSLSDNLTIEPVCVSPSMYVSTAGSGGGDQGVYDLPIEHLPIKGLSSDKVFNNLVKMQLSNYLITGGFVELPTAIPGTFLGSSITLSSKQVDALGRTYYASCSPSLNFYAEGLQSPVARKIYVPVLARIVTGNNLFEKGEYVLAIFSKHTLLEKENSVDSGCVSIYRVFGRSLSRL